MLQEGRLLPQGDGLVSRCDGVRGGQGDEARLEDMSKVTNMHTERLLAQIKRGHSYCITPETTTAASTSAC